MNVLGYIKEQVHTYNRNFVGIVVGRVGTGKSYTTIRFAEELDPTFNVDRIVFKVEDLLDIVHENKLPPGSVIVFDEAGIGVSNRQHYMNKFNKAMGFLLQTWRARNLILFVTVPDLGFVDAGVRKMFDALIETTKVIKSKRVVRVKWKFIQVNPQLGKAYFHGLTDGNCKIDLLVKKPSVKLIHIYEKKKEEFLTELYKDIKTTLEPPKQEVNAANDRRRCPECKTLSGRFKPTTNTFLCRSCGATWKNPGAGGS